MTILAATLFVACKREDTQTATPEQTQNRVIALPNDSKTGNNPIVLSTTCGHSRKDCKGCMMVNGHLIHVDCMGNGTCCTVVAAVQLQQVGSTITATTTDTFDLTSEDFFLMPDRSLYYGEDEKGQDVYLNIPEQQVERNSTTLQFTFTGLFFSNTAAYENN